MCAQCFGRGARVCQRCFGTGLANVKGLLRRPEATLLVQKMQSGTLQPGDVKDLIEQVRVCVCVCLCVRAVTYVSDATQRSLNGHKGLNICVVCTVALCVPLHCFAPAGQGPDEASSLSAPPWQYLQQRSLATRS